MRQEDFPEKMLFGTIIDIDTNVCGMERCSHDSQMVNIKDNKRVFIVIQDYKNNSKTTIKLNNIIVKITALN